MRVFLFILSVLSLLLSAHRFSLAEGTGQFKGALFLLLVGIQLLIAAALIGDQRDDRDHRSPVSAKKANSNEAESRSKNATVEQEERF
jgi:hypothetical protein